MMSELPQAGAWQGEGHADSDISSLNAAWYDVASRLCDATVELAGEHLHDGESEQLRATLGTRDFWGHHVTILERLRSEHPELVQAIFAKLEEKNFEYTRAREAETRRQVRHARINGLTKTVLGFTFFPDPFEVNER